MFALLWELWRNGRTLAATARALAHEVDQLRMEWSDVLDQLRAREERVRKRDRKAIQDTVNPEAGSTTQMRLFGAPRGF